MAEPCGAYSLVSKLVANDKYAEQCLNMVKSGVIDGIFADGCARTPTPLVNTTESAYFKAWTSLLNDGKLEGRINEDGRTYLCLSPELVGER